MLCSLASFESNFLFLCFQLGSPTLIVIFLTTGVFPSPIVIFSFLLCGLASFDSNLLFERCRFFAFRFLPFCFFSFVIMRLPKTISLQVGRKLADKTKDEILTEVLRVFAGLDVKAVQVAYQDVRVTFASSEHFRAAKSFSRKHLFGLCCSILGGGPPITRVHVFDFPFEEDDRSLEVAFEAYGLGNCSFDGSAGDSCGFFRPWPHLRSLRRPVSLVILLTLSFLRITSSIY